MVGVLEGLGMDQNIGLKESWDRFVIPGVISKVASQQCGGVCGIVFC